MKCDAEECSVRAAGLKSSGSVVFKVDTMSSELLKAMLQVKCREDRIQWERTGRGDRPNKTPFARVVLTRERGNIGETN